MKCNTLLKNFFFFLHIYVYTFEINKQTKRMSVTKANFPFSPLVK
jgi:hypothetical protein